MIAFAIIPSNLGITNEFRYAISAFGATYIVFGGFIFCSIMAYFAGLIGSTNSPVSGLLVSALLIICLILIACFNMPAELGVIIAIGSLVVIGAALAIANDTMQDLKVGQIVGATPWKQQVMLFIGVAVSAFIIPLILDLLYNAYGIGGSFPRPNMNPEHMLAAPQAGLMATIAKATFDHTLEWNLIGIGASIAIVCVIIDEVLKKHYDTRLPVLAVGLGIYLPLDSSMPVVIGGFLSYLIHTQLNKRYQHDHDKLDVHTHRGMLLTCGIVAGASLMGVLLAIPFAFYESADALKLMPTQYQSLASLLSIIVTVALCSWIYRVVMKK